MRLPRCHAPRQEVSCLSAGSLGVGRLRAREADQDPIVCTLQDFVSAVMDVDYSPTGREFVAGSYDRSVRIFAYQGGHSREVGIRVPGFQPRACFAVGQYFGNFD